MNWKLIFGLSAVGLGMAFASVYSIPPEIEPICWVAIFLTSTYFIASTAPGMYFMHGIIVCIIDCIFATATQVLLLDTYLPRHPLQIDMYAKIYAQTGLTPVQTILISRPALGILIGILVGFLAVFSSKYFSTQETATAPVENMPEEENDRYIAGYQSIENDQTNVAIQDNNAGSQNNNSPSLVYSLIVLVNPSDKQIKWVNEEGDNENAIIIPNVLDHPIHGLTFSGMHFDLID